MNCAPNNKPPDQAGFNTARRISCARPCAFRKPAPKRLGFTQGEFKNGNRRPKKADLSLSILLVPTVVALLTGCLSSDPVKFESRVRDWIPLGTPTAEALRTMQRHGFECHLITTNNPFNAIGSDYLDCAKERVRLHDWYAQLILRDGKVSAYGPIKTN